MGSSFEIDPEKGLILSSYWGEVKADEILAHIRAVHADPRFRKGMHSLADFSQARIADADLEAIFRFTDVVKDEVQHVRGSCRWALVVPDTGNRSLARLFQLMGGDLMITVEIFDNRPEALAWLTH
ncbi:MAG: hypothetical protein AB1634_19290 [Thermodesulfobacteriota bacterium]